MILNLINYMLFNEVVDHLQASDTHIYIIIYSYIL